jgi:hypothetical protein
MSCYVGIYIKHCNLCNWTKVQGQQPFGELHPLETPEAPWDVISINFIVELPESHGYDTIMNIVNSITKCVRCIPMHTTITAEGAAQLYLRDVWKHNGTPRVILSNRGSQFIAGFMCKLYKLLGIKLATSTAYHPQTDGQTEHINQELEGYLRIFTSRRQDNWDELLPLGEFSHNNHVHSSTQQTPFMVDTGRHPHMGFEPQQPHSKLESVNKFAEHMAQGLEEAKAALTKAKDEYAMYYNRHWEPAPVFTQGDKVWLDGSNITTNRPSSKLSHQHLGPFVIDKCVGHVHTVSFSLPTSAASTQSSPLSNCPLPIQIPSWANDLHYPHPQLSSTARKSMRSRRYWIAGCATTASSIWSNRRAITRVIIDGRSICSYTQSQR